QVCSGEERCRPLRQGKGDVQSTAHSHDLHTRNWESFVTEPIGHEPDGQVLTSGRVVMSDRQAEWAIASACSALRSMSWFSIACARARSTTSSSSAPRSTTPQGHSMTLPVVGSIRAPSVMLGRFVMLGRYARRGCGKVGERLRIYLTGRIGI